MNKNTRLKLVTENSASITIPNTKYPSPHHHNLPSFSFHKSSCNFSTISNTHYDAAIIYSSFHKSTLLQVSQYHTHLHTHTHTHNLCFVFISQIHTNCSQILFPVAISKQKKQKTKRIAAQRSSREKVKSFPTCNLLYLALSSTDLNGSVWLVLRLHQGVVFRRILPSSGFARLSFLPQIPQFYVSVGCIRRSRRNATCLDDKIFFVVSNVYSMHRLFQSVNIIM